ncbi:MAG: DUF2520 domain-containing protein [Myxococcaceae bacterium]|nr:DUF2520 domain-containing protein [Myxococcaceae bacterium]MCI0672002.1 DUF2520 domain-containing protein [Myxococcaceae bacterium]
MTARASRRPAVVVAGFGRLGGALALGLQRAGWTVTALAEAPASRRRAEELGVALADAGALRAARVCVLAVQDAAVARRAEAVAPLLSPRCALVHCAGALSLEAFGRSKEVRSRPLGSFHPLVAVSDPRASLAGHSVALSASSPALLRHLRRMAVDLGLRPLHVPEHARPAYHAGAVLSAGGAVSLLAAAARALAEAGLTEEEAVAALVPLMRSALKGVEERGLRRGLTGPVARGDVEVVRAHLDALPPEVASVYRPLVEWSLRLATLPEEVRAAMARVGAAGSRGKDTAPSPRPSPRGRGESGRRGKRSGKGARRG